MKSFAPRFVAAATLALFLALAARAAESLSLLLQKGIYAEETEGNLDSAIKIYAQIAAESAANRTLAAQAQYRLAVCYQKMGKNEQAIKLATEMLQHVGGDPGLTKKAKDILLVMGITPAETMVVRRLSATIPGWPWPGGLSRDGRFIAYEPSGGYDVAVLEIATGKSTFIAKSEKDKSPSSVALSLDGQLVAYDLSDATVYLARLDGSQPRKLVVGNPSQEQIWPIQWSTDGSELFICVQRVADRSCAVFSVDVKTAAKTEIGRRAAHDTEGMWSFSPNGRFAARRRQNYPHQISVWDLKTGREEVVLPVDAGDLVGWSPDGARLVYCKTRSPGAPDLLVSEMDEGKPVGDPRVVRAEYPASTSIGISRDGTLFYAMRTNRSQPAELWVMEGFLGAKPTATPTEAWRIQSEIPSTELVTENETFTDRKFGFTAKLVDGWTIRSAMRQGSGGNVLYFLSPALRAATAQVRVIYWSTTPWSNPANPANDFAALGPKPTASEEIDAWLRKRVSVAVETMRTNGDSMTKIESNEHRVINGYRTFSAVGPYERSGKKWTQMVTLFYTDKLVATCQLRVPSDKFEEIRPSVERFLHTVQLP